ncbi:unnamed protein product [Lepeophtheirus salmonis]|uniref:(salmon louse) hypothetical protein n=1 Tax=Lepeophtheirus salmonis TaxID=72036 RepID=A0A7R8HE08_LEPSM|nr:unnamed protein product [Lepeophtheirus salmonis]CAF3021245.1 unnamed protein product [Lepeophtheirus salmonis]
MHPLQPRPQITASSGRRHPHQCFIHSHGKQQAELEEIIFSSGTPTTQTLCVCPCSLEHSQTYAMGFWTRRIGSSLVPLKWSRLFLNNLLLFMDCLLKAVLFQQFMVSFLGKTQALPFVLLGQMDRDWRLLKPTLLLDMKAFSRYLEDTWIGTFSNEPLFSQLSWNQYDACHAGIPRSSNVLEGWHHGFQSLFNCAEPTIWKLMDGIKLEQAITDNKIVQHLRRQPPYPRKRKLIQFDYQLKTIVEQL